jgi:hypothetical protein
MPDVFAEIQKKKEKDMQKEIDAKVKRIDGTRDALLEYLKGRELSVMEASYALKAAMETINNKVGMLGFDASI